jgi:hypothetical protein
MSRTAASSSLVQHAAQNAMMIPTDLFLVVEGMTLQFDHAYTDPGTVPGAGDDDDRAGLAVMSGEW